jgi:hypothetical protein
MDRMSNRVHATAHPLEALTGQELGRAQVKLGRRAVDDTIKESV